MSAFSSSQSISRVCKSTEREGFIRGQGLVRNEVYRHVSAKECCEEKGQYWLRQHVEQLHKMRVCDGRLTSLTGKKPWMLLDFSLRMSFTPYTLRHLALAISLARASSPLPPLPLTYLRQGTCSIQIVRTTLKRRTWPSVETGCGWNAGYTSPQNAGYTSPQNAGYTSPQKAGYTSPQHVDGLEMIQPEGTHVRSLLVSELHDTIPHESHRLGLCAHQANQGIFRLIPTHVRGAGEPSGMLRKGMLAESATCFLS